MRLPLFVFGLLASGILLRAAEPSLLTEAVTRWSGERHSWAFTQRVKEFDGGEIRQERVETFDPSRPENKRWALLKVDGRAPTSDEWTAWDKRKNKKRRRDPKPLMEYFDFARARLIRDEGATAVYELPLRNTSAWLFPADKVELQLAVNRQSRAVERVDARINEPFKVALGLARVLDFELDLVMQPVEGAGAGDPAAASPDGTMRAVVNKFGQRVEYNWSEFRRVTPHADKAVVIPKS
jgi:hypothetical protein